MKPCDETCSAPPTLAVLALLFLFPIATPAAPQELAWHLAGDDDVHHRAAEKACKKAKADGRSDWRLPTPAEMDALAGRATGGDEAAVALLDSLGDAAAWTDEVSDSGLAWAAAFAHGYQFRIQQGNERALRALCVAGPEGAVDGDDPGFDDLEEGPWQRPLDVETDSPLLWGCSGTESGPVILTGSVERFVQALPPGPLREVVPVDFVIDAEGHPRWAGPAPGTDDRLGRLAVTTLDGITYAPNTCDGEPTPVFFHLDFGQSDRRR